MTEAPTVVITKGGNRGGRRTISKFGDQPESIVNTLAFLSPELRKKFHENQRKHSENASSLERWAANDYVAGYEVM